jgi:hypothetical protein
MPLRIVDELKESATSALRQASLISAVALALVITASFLCAAGFVVVLENFGAVAATLDFLPNARVYRVKSVGDACDLITKNGRELLGL